MCSVFRAMPYYQAGSLTITQDSPKDSSYLFTLANTLPPGLLTKYEPENKAYSSSCQILRI